MKILALFNIKGGVGKTAGAVNLAFLSALEGARTLVWDLDPQGASSFYFRVKPKVKGGGKALIKGERELDAAIKGTDYPGLDLLPADFSYRHLDRALDRHGGKKKGAAAGHFSQLLQPLEARYDRLFLDCPPSISRLSESVFVAADGLVVPTIPTVLSLRTLDQLRAHLERKGPRRLQVLPYYSMVDRRKSLHREIVAGAGEPAYPMLDTVIPYSTWVERMGIHRAPLSTYAHHTEAAQAYLALWAEIRGRLGG